jgi:hypothetical protein
MKKYLSLALSLMMVICLIGCSNNNTSSTENKDNAIKNQSLKIGESYYDIQDRGDGIWDVYYSVEVINPNSYDANNYQGLFIDCQDEDGYSIKEEGMYTGYILAKDHTYISYYVTAVSEKPAKVKFRIEDIENSGGFSEPLAKGKKSNDLFKLKETRIDDVNNYGYNPEGKTHKELVGAICSNMEEYPEGVSEVEVIGVFYKDKKLIGSTGKHISNLDYKDKQQFNISPNHVDINDSSTYDDYKIVIAFPSVKISSEDSED